MREIKFRVWNKQSKKMVYYDKDCSAPIMTLNGVLLHHGTHTNLSYMYELMQFTGLKDKNGKGKKIYGNDIISTFEGIKYLVYWDVEWGQWWGRIIKETKGKFTRPLYGILNNSYMEIIGTVHTHPELMEQENA